MEDMGERIEHSAAASEEQNASVEEITSIMSTMERHAGSVDTMSKTITEKIREGMDTGKTLSDSALALKKSVREIKAALAENKF